MAILTRPQLNKQVRQNLLIFNENKILILQALLNCADSLCGCDLTERLGIAKNLLSYHLKTLRSLGLVSEVRCGQRKQYTIPFNKRSRVKAILSILESE